VQIIGALRVGKRAACGLPLSNRRSGGLDPLCDTTNRFFCMRRQVGVVGPIAAVVRRRMIRPQGTTHTLNVTKACIWSSPAVWPGEGSVGSASVGHSLVTTASPPLPAAETPSSHLETPRPAASSRDTPEMTSLMQTISSLRLQLDASSASFLLKEAAETRVPSCRLFRQFPGRVAKVDFAIGNSKTESVAEDSDTVSPYAGNGNGAGGPAWTPAFRTAMVRLATEGISWNGSRWVFFHGKPRDTSCIVVAVEAPRMPTLSVSDFLAWHVPPSKEDNLSMIPSKFASRLDLALSKTLAVRGSELFEVKEIEDVVTSAAASPAAAEETLLTDGCGFISPFAMAHCYAEENEKKARISAGSSGVAPVRVGLPVPPPCSCAATDALPVETKEDDSLESPALDTTAPLPAAVQGRLGGNKGVWLINPFLKGTTVCVRPSQRKVVLDSPTKSQKQLEMLKLSSPSGPASLNLQILMLLFSHGVTADAVTALGKTYADDLTSSAFC
jgi:RNA dependent RNA polymerase